MAISIFLRRFSNEVAKETPLSNRKLFNQLPFEKTTLELIQKERMSNTRPIRKSHKYKGPDIVPGEKDEYALKKFLHNLKFVAAAKTSSSFPQDSECEIAFAGRSNVGKSSLLNALVPTGSIAKVSIKPGFTQSINFFQLGKRNNFLVDMPGYGFAFAKDEVQQNWQKLVDEYATERKELKRLFLLIDARHGFKLTDKPFLELLNRSKTKFQVILTKCDLVEPLFLARRHLQIKTEVSKFRQHVDEPILLSSKTNAGILKLRRVILHLFNERM